MKKLVFLLSLVLATAYAKNSMAQGVGVSVYEEHLDAYVSVNYGAQWVWEGNAGYRRWNPHQQWNWNDPAQNGWFVGGTVSYYAYFSQMDHNLIVGGGLDYSPVGGIRPVAQIGFSMYRRFDIGMTVSIPTQNGFLNGVNFGVQARHTLNFQHCGFANRQRWRIKPAFF